MDVNKDDYNFGPLPEYTQESTPNTLLPPPYMDEPPAYSAVAENSCTVYACSHDIPDYMSKLPFGELSNSSSHSPLPPPPPDVQIYTQQSFNPQVVNQQSLYQEVMVNYPTNSTLVSPQHSTTTKDPHNSPADNQPNSNCAALHKVLLQPSSSRIVETRAVGHRKKKSHVTDLATGKEYFVKEKTSRNGKRSKAVIKEVGGPKTYVKETPTKTLVCQKK